VIGLEMIERWSLKSSAQWSCMVTFVTFGPARKLLVWGLTSSSYRVARFVYTTPPAGARASILAM